MRGRGMEATFSQAFLREVEPPVVDRVAALDDKGPQVVDAVIDDKPVRGACGGDSPSGAGGG